jgi:hypothetical protein
MPYRSIAGLVFLALSAVPALAQSDAPPAEGDAVAAQWEPHQVRFRYAGFTTDYTCDGIRHKVKLLLQALGARKDVKVTGSCGDVSRPQPFHNLQVAFAIPVAAPEGAAEGETFQARWQEVSLARHHDIEGGDCELVEQFVQQVLPLLNARDVKNEVRCVPHKANLHQPRLTLTVLMPVEEQEAPGDPPVSPAP